jgi:hypothetical protein
MLYVLEQEVQQLQTALLPPTEDAVIFIVPLLLKVVEVKSLLAMESGGQVELTPEMGVVTVVRQVAKGHTTEILAAVGVLVATLVMAVKEVITPIPQLLTESLDLLVQAGLGVAAVAALMLAVHTEKVAAAAVA